MYQRRRLDLQLGANFGRPGRRKRPSIPMQPYYATCKCTNDDSPKYVGAVFNSFQQHKNHCQGLVSFILDANQSKRLHTARQQSPHRKGSIFPVQTNFSQGQITLASTLFPP